MSDTFPPTGPTTLLNILPAYVYQQYSDDDNIQAFNTSFNLTAQSYLDWFNQINLPIYTQEQISGALLDWVAQAIYGLTRPSLAFSNIQGVGPLNTWETNTTAPNQFYTTGSVTNFTTTDDIFKRILTWYFFKGDGQAFTIGWLKRRVMRFLVGAAGTAPNIDNTYPVSVSFGVGGAVTITITLTSVTAAAGITLLNAQFLQTAVQASAVPLPFQFSFLVDIVNDM